MIRLSSYTIVSEPLPDGSKILMNGCSGAVDSLPSELAAFFEYILANSPRGQAFVDTDYLHPETHASLLERGHLTHLTHEEEQGIVAEISRGLHEQETSRPYFMIAPNMDCNYRCTYCFERHLQKTLKSETSNISYLKDNVVLRPDAIPKIYAAIERIQTHADHEIGGMVILYGGEPLDADNRDLIFDIVQTGMRKGYWFAAITNGHDLDTFLPIIGQNMLSQIQISIDGPKPVHDRRRVYRGKESSFDKIVANLRKVLDQGGAEVHIRVHVDPTNIGLFEEVMTFFEREGWTNHDSVIIYANTVYEKDDGGLVSVEIEVADIARRLDAMVSGYWNVFTSAPAVHAARALEPVLETGARFALKGTYCSANFGNYIFAPDGHIYSCWESIGKECSKIGSYLTAQGLVFDPVAVQKWFSRNIAEIPECLECAFALVCGGGCAQYAEYNSGSIYKPYCDDFQRTFRIALADEVARTSLPTAANAPLAGDGNGSELFPLVDSER